MGPRLENGLAVPNPINEGCVLCERFSMGGNSFGDCFRITTFGESHGMSLGVIVDGCPPGVKLDESIVQEMLNKRRPGQKSITSTRRNEHDRAVIHSGVFEGLTTGMPIMIMVSNSDARSRAYSELKDVFRPGHGDITYYQKYGLRDWRGGGRASARETLSRVAAGAVAKAVLAPLNVKVTAYTIAMGGVQTTERNLSQIGQNPFLCPSLSGYEAMLKVAEEARAAKDTIGGVVEILAENVPAGLGEPVFDKLDAVLAQAIMSIGAIKGVEIGAGFAAAMMRGSQNNDTIMKHGFASNHAGGILAGISSGQHLLIRAAVKPIPSIGREQETVDITGEPRKITVEGRHDICAIPRVNVVCEAMVYITLADFMLKQKAIM